jgi:ELWxxDGT repeat protein
LGRAVPVQAGSASLLLDILSDRAFPADVVIQGEILSLGPVALVSIKTPGSGRELWSTDGTAVGTRPLLDLCPGACSSYFTPLGTVRQIGIFSAYSEINGTSRLWRSDGTRPGTVGLEASPGVALQSCGGAAATRSALLFAARPAGGTCALWKTDGSVAGTVKLQDLAPSGLTTAGNLIYYAVFAGGKWALWRTDGTPQGTIQLHLWLTDSPRFFVVSGSRLFFTAPEDGRELWTSDGTVAGTRSLTHFSLTNPFVFRSSFAADIVFQDAGGLACFLADDTAAGRELWCSDGTPAGTRAATALPLASPFVGLEKWRVEKLGGHLLFPVNDGVHGNRWWTSDGRASSAAPLAGCSGECPVVDPDSFSARLGGQLFFAAQDGVPFDPDDKPATDLWITDGTGAGTKRLRDFCDDCRVDRMVPLLGKLFFGAGESFASFDLWASDGTPQGTRMLRSLSDFPEKIFPYPPAAVGGLALLVQEQGVWVSDGTPAGTQEVAFLPRSSEGSQPQSLVPTNDGARFLAYDGESLSIWTSHGTPATTTALIPEEQIQRLIGLGNLTLFEGYGDDALGRTDGTAAGTFRLVSGGLRIGQIAILGNRALFISPGQGGSKASLWATDGTVAGTRQIVELPEEGAGLEAAGSSVALIRMFHSPDDVFWRTDGTAGGTYEIPLPADFRSIGNRAAAQLGSALFFRGYTSQNGESLWKSEGTAEARPFALDIVGEPGDFAVRAGSLYVLAHTTGPGVESGLFRSDGTEAGTVLLATVPRSTTAVPENAQLTAVGNLVFFILNDERHGRELWRTDGTPAGTFLVRDIVPGLSSSGPDHLTALNGRLYFTAAGLGTGDELWESDGTEAGTRLVQDIAPGVLSADPEELVAGGGKLYFTADDGVHGREPWVYTPGGAVCEATATALCLGGHFRVEADWRTPALSGRGHGVALTADTGYFWFFDPANVEVVLKVLDGQGINGHEWVFYGALSNVEYSLTVTDTLTGASRRYVNPPGHLGSVGDTTAFGPKGASVSGVISEGPASTQGEAIVATRAAAPTQCVAGPTRLCLSNGRFAVEARWKNTGQTGDGHAVTLTGDTGTFWFFQESNVEVVLKVLDGRPANGKFWVFYGALSDVEYTLTVTDTQTGVMKTYTNPKGRLASVADTGAF